MHHKEHNSGSSTTTSQGLYHSIQFQKYWTVEKMCVLELTKHSGYVCNDLLKLIGLNNLLVKTMIRQDSYLIAKHIHADFRRTFKTSISTCLILKEPVRHLWQHIRRCQLKEYRNVSKTGLKEEKETDKQRVLNLTKLSKTLIPI